MIYLRPFGAWRARFAGVTDPGLHVCEVAVAFGKASQQSRIELQLCAWRDRVDSILLIDRLPQHDAPTPAPPFQKIVEAAGANNVTDYTFNIAPLGDCHFSLRNCVVADDLDRDPSEEMQDTHAALPALFADTDKFIGTPLKPGCHHAPVGMPHLAKSLPIAGVAPDDPIFEQIANLPAVGVPLLRHCHRIHTRSHQFVYENMFLYTYISVRCQSGFERSPGVCRRLNSRWRNRLLRA